MASVCQKLTLVAITMAMAICAASLTAAAVASSNSPEDFVELHNAARAAVSWDAEAARHAARRAAAGCAGGRGSVGGGGYGENVFRGTGAAGSPGKKAAWAAAADAMRAWTAPAATEYAQVVWPGSDRVGCAHAVCGAGEGERGVVISCSYRYLV